MPFKSTAARLTYSKTMKTKSCRMSRSSAVAGTVSGHRREGRRLPWQGLRTGFREILPAGQRQELGEQHVDEDGDHGSDDDIRGGCCKQQGGIERETCAKGDQAIKQASAASIRMIGFQSRLSRAGRSPLSPGSIVDGEQCQPARDNDRHDLQTKAVRGQDLKLARVLPDDAGQDEKNNGDDEARHVDAPLRR